MTAGFDEPTVHVGGVTGPGVLERVHDLRPTGRAGWVLDLDGFAGRCISAVATGMSDRVELLLAVKSIADRRFLDAAAAAGVGFDCSNLTELQHIASHARLGSAVSFTPAAVPDPDLDELWRILGALDDVRIHWSTLDQLERARSVEPALDHGLRLFAPDCAPHEPGHYPQSRFGVRLADLSRVWEADIEGARSSVTSVHVHNGSGRHTASWFARAAETILESMTTAGLDLRLLNLGGGLAHEPYRDLPDVVAAARSAVPVARLRLEPGGWWTSGLIWLAAPVLDVVPGEMCDFVVIDAGAENHRRWSLPQAPSFGPASQGNSHVIAGRTCSEMDYFAQAPPFEGSPVPRRGDWVVLGMSGYSLELENHFGGLGPLPRLYVDHQGNT